jgi:hypothetical protein
MTGSLGKKRLCSSIPLLSEVTELSLVLCKMRKENPGLYSIIANVSVDGPFS